MPSSICITNQKGGVGKTTLAHALARLSSRDVPTTVIDLDPQGSLTSCFIQDLPETANVRLLFEKTAKGESRLQELTPVQVAPNLFLLGSDVSLAVYEVEAGGPGRFYRLRTYLSTHADGWTLVDTPPNLAVLTVNALLACDFALIPVDASKFSVRGLADLFSTMHELNTDLRSGPGQQLKVAGIVLANVNARLSYAQKVIDNLRQQYAPFIMDTMIPASTRVREATAEGRIVTEGPAAPAFEAFYAELQRRIV